MHWKICKWFGIEVKERWYEHDPKTVTENNSVNILWDMPIHTDRTIATNRQDIVYPSTPTLQSKPRRSLPNTKTWKSRLSECGGSKQQQSRLLWEPLASSRRAWKTTPTKSLATSTYMNSRKLSFLEPTFSGGSSPSSRNPLCLPKSMVWTLDKLGRRERKSIVITLAYLI